MQLSGVILVWLSHGMPISYCGYPEGNRFSYGYPVLTDKLLPAYPLVSVCGNLEYLCVTVLIKASISMLLSEG